MFPTYPISPLPLQVSSFDQVTSLSEPLGESKRIPLILIDEDEDALWVGRDRCVHRSRLNASDFGSNIPGWVKDVHVNVVRRGHEDNERSVSDVWGIYEMTAADEILQSLAGARKFEVTTTTKDLSIFYTARGGLMLDPWAFISVDLKAGCDCWIHGLSSMSTSELVVARSWL
ncbi:hypothetical protein AKJ16_DCAP15878 [Drosera capensis]